MAQTNTPITNLERALPPAARTHVRARRHGDPRPAPARGVPDHYLAVLDRAHLRIFRVHEPVGGGTMQLTMAASADFPAGHLHYTDRDTDQAGRFPGAQGRGAGGSIDERLPMQAEEERRLVASLAAQLGRFFEEHHRSTWDYAAGPAIHQAVLDLLPAGVRGRLGVAVVKELVHHTPAQLRAHFGWNDLRP